MGIILVDMDGPLADFEGGFLIEWRKRFPNDFFLPIERRTKFYLTEEYPANLKEKIESIRYAEGFFTNLPLVANSVDAIKEMTADGFDVRVCSSAIFNSKNCLVEKKFWLAKYFGEDLAKSAIFCGDKTLIRGNYLIDDRPTIVGKMIPEWKRIIFEQPFNKDIETRDRIKTDWSNWREIITR